MNDIERLALADRVQKRLQKKHPDFRLIQKRDKIEKELNVNNFPSDINVGAHFGKRSHKNIANGSQDP